MKGSLGFDPRDYDYGPATSAVHSILTEWSEIDWFEAGESEPIDAANLFREHQRLANAYDPEAFPASISIDYVEGNWPTFVDWCKRVRSNSKWDWKFSALKTLSSKHEKACGWSAEAEAPLLTSSPRPGDLFFKARDATGNTFVMWNGVMPKITALDALPREPLGESARFYLGYAQGDALDCIKWQFAERSPDLSRNPFLPLLLCYGAGSYPFSIDRDTVVLFRFARDP